MLHVAVVGLPPSPAPCPVSPTHPPTAARSKLGAAVGRRLPPVLILHGTADKSVPMEIAIEFVAALKVGN